MKIMSGIFFYHKKNFRSQSHENIQVCAYELKLEDCLIEHPLVQWAVSAVAAFQTGDYGRFLSEFYARTDLLTAIMMSLHANFARTMVLFQMLCTGNHFFHNCPCCAGPHFVSMNQLC